MAVLTGANGQLLFGGSPAGCVRNWSLTITKDGLETTCLGEDDRKYRPGLRGATGTADILYDPTGPAGGVFNTILDNFNEVDTDLAFVLSTTDGKQIGGKGMITSITANVAVGELQAASVTFQISGPITGGW